LSVVFSTGQTALYVTIVAVITGALREVSLLGPDVAGLGRIGAIVLAAALLHLCNSGLVAIAAALQLGRNPVRVWATNLAYDVRAHAVLFAPLAREERHVSLQTAPTRVPLTA
jgi:hypothetical protein